MKGSELNEKDVVEEKKQGEIEGQRGIVYDQPGRLR